MIDIDDNVAKDLLTSFFKIRCGYIAIKKSYDLFYGIDSNGNSNLIFSERLPFRFYRKDYAHLIHKCLGKEIECWNSVEQRYIYVQFPDTIEELMIENDLMSND